MFVGILFSTLWLYLFFTSNATNRFFFLKLINIFGSQALNQGAIYCFCNCFVACESSFSLCKFHFESPKRRFFTLKDFHRNKIGKYTTHKRILAFSRVFPQSTLTLFAKYGLYYKIIKKTCNYILKIYATRTDIGIFEGTRSYAALRAADQDWIVGPGVHFGVFSTCCISLFYLL